MSSFQCQWIKFMGRKTTSISDIHCHYLLFLIFSHAHLFTCIKSLSWIRMSSVSCLQFPREPHRSTRILQLTGRWQYSRIMGLASHSTKLLMLTSLIRFLEFGNSSFYKKCNEAFIVFKYWECFYLCRIPMQLHIPKLIG